MANENSKYGGRGRPWHEDFIRYVEWLAAHENYKGMPDAYSEPGRVQWEAPSNRTSGKFKETHNKRRRWWQKKAAELDIEVGSPNWISRTARNLHPTKQKPCKICGRNLSLLYVYPNSNTLKRIPKLLNIPSSFELDPNQTIFALVSELFELVGDRLFPLLPKMLKAKGVEIPTDIKNDIEPWLAWIHNFYVPSEPSTLGPGAMSNAPDRFDGFHSDNRCCRASHDKGRAKLNMSKYTTDRRVFEYWAEGDWIAADRLMGLVRTKFSGELCLNGHPGPCDAYHIGPLSLGFSHRPCFQLLCSSCNSGKNNRMTHGDVMLLIAHERTGSDVISWHSKKLWEMLRHQVKDDETALRLSKIMRDNRHNFMSLLRKIFDNGYFSFLGGLLELECADEDIAFKNLRIEDHVTVYDELVRESRTTKYAIEQKARRTRIAFEALTVYDVENGRNAFIIESSRSKGALDDLIYWLRKNSDQNRDFQIAEKLSTANSQEDWAEIVSMIPNFSNQYTIDARKRFQNIMDIIAEELSNYWDNERYVRN